MKRYRVTGMATITVSTLVSAENEQDAIDQAEQHTMRTLCHGCGTESDEEWTATELDGEPRKLEAEEIDDAT